MGTPNSNQYFEAIHAPDGTPSSPNLFNVNDIVAGGGVNSAAISTATSTAVSTVNAAAPDSTSISQANSRATSAATNASVADSKAVSVSTVTSTADSKALSVSVNASAADSKAESAVLVASRATSVLQTAFSASPGIPYPTITGETGVASLYYAYNDARRFGFTVSNTASANYTAFQNALASVQYTGGELRVTAGSYSVNDELLPLSNTRITLEPGVTITQTVANKTLFKVVQKSNVHILCNGATLYGEGSWSAAWSDFSSHQDRGVQFLGCTNCSLVKPVIRNMAMCGIAILGGTNIVIDSPIIEGTHALGHPLTLGVSIYQFGMVIMHDVTYGAFEAVHVESPTIFNVAMGINSVENIALSNGLLTIESPTIYNIRGQHGLYMGTSNTSITNPTIDNTGLDGIKIYSGANNEQIRNVVITDFNISNCTAGQAIEFGVSGTGFVAASRVSGTAYNCARALVLDGDIRNVTGKITSDTMSQYALYMAQGSGTGPTDCDIEVNSRNTTQYSILVAASTSDRNRIKPKINRPSSGAGGYSGIYVNASAGLTIESPVVQDDAGNMLYGIFIDTGGVARITGTPVISGYSSFGIRVDGTCEYHGSGGSFTTAKTAVFDTGDKLVPITHLSTGTQTVSAANLNLWKLTLEDESAYLVEAVITGKLQGSAQRGTFKTNIICYRDGGGSATLEGAEFGNSSRVSASFTGTYSWGVTGNAVRILVNSGGVSTTDWIGTVRVTRLVG